MEKKTLQNQKNHKYSGKSLQSAYFCCGTGLAVCEIHELGFVVSGGEAWMGRGSGEGAAAPLPSPARAVRGSS